jgi:uncharacterized protein
MPANFVGPPVRGKDCYGRDSFVELVWEKLSFGHVILAAPRRFGKTSVMYRLIDEPRWDYRLIHCDLEHFTEAADLLTALAVQLANDEVLCAAMTSLSYLPKKAWRAFRGNVDELELYKLKIKLKEQFRPAWQELGEELFEAVADTSHTVVFILDEFAVMIDRMAHDPNRREEARTLLRWLRNLRQSPRTKNVRFLVAGSIGIGHVLQQLGESASINDFEQLKLAPFPATVADEFLQALAKSHKVALTAPVRKRILQLVGTRVPYFLQIMFSELSKDCRQSGVSPTPAMVNAIYRDSVLGSACKTYFDHYYGRLHDYYDLEHERAAKAILRRLAAADELRRDSCYQLYREQAPASDVEAFYVLMAHLENDFYISFDAKRGAYQFSCKLLRDWWLRHYGMEV